MLEFPGDTTDPFVHWLGKGEEGRHEWALRFYSRATARPNRISAYRFNAAGGLGSGAYFEDALTTRPDGFTSSPLTTRQQRQLQGRRLDLP